MSCSNNLATRELSCEESIVDRPLLTSSTLGRFIRKFKIEYQKLDFRDAGLFWSIFVNFRNGFLQPSGDDYALLSPDLSSGESLSNLSYWACR